MNRNYLLKISTMVMVLILFPATVFSLPLTKTLYIVPPDMLDISVGADYFFADSHVVRERFTAGTGLWSGVCLSAEFDALGKGIAGFESPGDSFIELMACMDSLSSADLRTAWYCMLRFPTGPDSYRNRDYMGAALGIGEVRTGPVIAYSVSAGSMAFINIFYTFRQDENEDFYGGFKLNLSESETYRALLGLNPFYKGAFLDYRRLSNDYFTVSAAWIYSTLYPFVLFTELYYSRRFVRSDTGSMSIAMEGGGASPLMVCGGLKYFISASVYTGGYGMVNILMHNGYQNLQAGIFCSLIF